MYLKHFGLSQTPFSLTPNTGFFFGLSPHVEALQVLQTALQTGEGFIKVTGEVGTGKTLICRKLINELPQGFHCAYLPNPYLTPAELRWAVANELGLKYTSEIDQQQLTGLIQQQLLALSAHGHAIVLVLDEAQALPEALLTRRLRDSLHGVFRRIQSGQVVLASVGAVSPFVGLFGTVWGIYHALVKIGMSGQASIDKVAGPVGEALIMTAIGLAVAVPAVLGYNWLVRRNKAVMEQVNAFGSDLHAVLLGSAKK